MRIRQIFLVLAAVLAFISCSKKEQEGNLNPINLSSQVKSLKSGAGANVDKTTNDNITDASMGVFGIYNNISFETQKGSNVFPTSEAQMVSYDSAQSKWVYSPVQNWQINRFYRFRAFHPYGGAAINLQSSDADDMIIGYSVAAGSEDLLVAFKEVEATIEAIRQPVNFDFVHALSGLKFEIAFKNIADIEDDYSDYLENFYLTGLAGTGTLHYTHEEGTLLTPKMIWYALSYDTDSKFYEWSADNGSSGKQFYKAGQKSPTMVFDGNDNMVYAVPQTRKANLQPTVVYFKTQAGGNSYQSVTLPDVDWKPGKIYVYSLLVNKSDIDIVLTIKDWSELQSNVNIYL